MSLTVSKMIDLGTIAPDFFFLFSVSEKMVSLKTLKSPVATVIIFMCNHCPFVKHIHEPLTKVASRYQEKGMQFIAISSNDITNYPEDAPEDMQAMAKVFMYPFPYLYDETQEVAKAYQATCTPDFFVFDKNLACVYRGRFDASTPGKDIPVTGEDLCAALNCILADKPVNPDQKPGLGCNIKWLDNPEQY